jgi:hypothetical protein
MTRQLGGAPKAPRPKYHELDHYSFDYSAHKVPMAYTTYATALELYSRTKLIVQTKNNYGAIVLKKVRTNNI